MYKQTGIPNRRATAEAAGRLLGALRGREILALQGAPLLGLALAQTGGRPFAAGPSFALCWCSVLLVAHVWTLNDFCDARADAFDADPARRRGRDAGPALLGFSFGLLIASLAAATVVSTAAPLLVLAIAALGAAYSCPPVRAKGVPFASSALHLAGGLLHFLLGYSTFAAVDGAAVALGGFFGLAFAAGHVVQEVQDHAADAAAGVRTHAVAFGPGRAFAGAGLAFAAVHGYLFLLAWTGILPIVLAPLAALAGACQWRMARGALNARLAPDAVRRYRGQYRWLFAALGLCMVAALLK